jgi:hypothetical protein
MWRSWPALQARWQALDGADVRILLAEREAEAAGCPRCRLWVLEEKRCARRFYQRHGWRRDERRRPVPFPPHPVEIGCTLDQKTRSPLRTSTDS